MTTCLFAAAFRCHPVKVAWNPVLPGKCLNFTTIFMATESLNCVMEVIIVCLPVDMIRKLQLPMRRKILVSGIFFVGGL